MGLNECSEGLAIVLVVSSFIDLHLINLFNLKYHILLLILHSIKL